MKNSTNYVLAALCILATACSSGAAGGAGGGTSKDAVLRSGAVAVQSGSDKADVLRFAIIKSGSNTKVVIQSLLGANCAEGTVEFNSAAVLASEDQGNRNTSVVGGTISVLGRRGPGKSAADGLVAIVPGRLADKCRKLEGEERVVYQLSQVDEGFRNLKKLSAEIDVKAGSIPSDLDLGSVHGSFGRVISDFHLGNAGGILLSRSEMYFGGRDALNDSAKFQNSYDLWLADGADAKLDSDRQKLKSMYQAAVLDATEAKIKNNQDTTLSEDEKQAILKPILAKLGY
jgi:hypothetical protein